MMKPQLTLPTICCLLTLLASVGQADQRDSANTPTRLFRSFRDGLRNLNGHSYQRNHWTVKRAFNDVVRTARQSTVRIRSNDRQVALGTVVDARGYILTKASQLPTGDPIEVDLGNGRKSRAAIVSQDREYDVALIKINATNLIPVRWSTSRPGVGAWLATADPGGDQPKAIGVVSSIARPIPAPPALLGVRFGESDDGPVITFVSEDSAAAHAGLMPQDVILSVDGRPMRSGSLFANTIASYKPGERVRLTIRRASSTRSLTAVLGNRADGEQSKIMDSLAGPLSDRRIGFPLALQHDSILKPHECGGPVVDLEGRVVGINIARSSRVATYAIPAEALQTLVPRLRSNVTQTTSIDAPQGTAD